MYMYMNVNVNQHMCCHVYIHVGLIACNLHSNFFLIRRLRERSVIALLHLAIRLMHREPARPLIIHGLQSLFLLSPETLVSFRVLQRQISHSLMELINSMVSTYTGPLPAHNNSSAVVQYSIQLNQAPSERRIQ